MKRRLLSTLFLLAGVGLMLGSCINEDGVTPYQRMQEDIAEIDTYLAANPPAEDDIMIRDAYSGIRIVVTETGTGTIPPTPENIIEVAYVGRRLSNGVLVNPPFEERTYTFTMTTADNNNADVIQGWKYALSMMTQGTKATVYIPSGMAYGARGSSTGAIGPNEILVFEMHLKIVNTTDEQPLLNEDLEDIDAFIATNNIQNVQIHPSGMRYVVNNVGTGATPGLYDHVRIRYTGRLMDTTTAPFADKVEQSPTSSFSSRTVNYIHGVTLGLQLMKVGGKTTFYIPSALAYGPDASDKVPARSIVIYEMELLEVIPNAE